MNPLSARERRVLERIDLDALLDCLGELINPAVCTTHVLELR